MRAAAVSGDPGIVQPRQDGQTDGGIKGHVAQDYHPCGRGELVQQNYSDSRDLGDRIGFAEEAGTEIAPAYHRIHESGDNEDGQIAPEDKDGDGGRNQAFVCEDHEERAEEKLVCDGIHVLAESCSLLKDAGQNPVESVCESGDNEERKRDSEAILEDGSDEKWREADADYGEKIWCCAERIPSRGGGICHRLS